MSASQTDCMVRGYSYQLPWIIISYFVYLTTVYQDVVVGVLGILACVFAAPHPPPPPPPDPSDKSTFHNTCRQVLWKHCGGGFD